LNIQKSQVVKDGQNCDDITKINQNLIDSIIPDGVGQLKYRKEPPSPSRASYPNICWVKLMTQLLCPKQFN